MQPSKEPKLVRKFGSFQSQSQILSFHFFFVTKQFETSDTSRKFCTEHGSFLTFIYKNLYF